MNTRRSFIRNLALVSVAPVVAAEPKPVYHNIYKSADAPPPVCAITLPNKALVPGSTLHGIIVTPEFAIECPVNTCFEIVLPLWDPHFGYGRYGYMHAFNIPGPGTATWDTVGVRNLVAHIKKRTLWQLWPDAWGERGKHDGVESYPQELLDYISGRADLHNSEAWRIVWTPTTFSIEDHKL